jgi:hypothetical protein
LAIVTLLVSPQLEAVQQWPNAVEMQLCVPAHSAVLAGQKQVPFGPEQLSPLIPRMRKQSPEVQQLELAMQELLPAHS